MIALARYGSLLSLSISFFFDIWCVFVGHQSSPVIHQKMNAITLAAWLSILTKIGETQPQLQTYSDFQSYEAQ